MTENPDGSFFIKEAATNFEAFEATHREAILGHAFHRKNHVGRRLVEALDLASCRYHLESYIPGITAMLDEARKEFCQ